MAGWPLFFASLAVVSIIGAVGMIISVLNFLTLDNESSLAFSGGRLIGLAAGMILFATLGQFVFVALPASFIVGTLILSLSVLFSLAVTLLPILLASNNSLGRLTYFEQRRIG